MIINQTNPLGLSSLHLLSPPPVEQISESEQAGAIHDSTILDFLAPLHTLYSRSPAKSRSYNSISNCQVS